jgi:hypothetical protein
MDDGERQKVVPQLSSCRVSGSPLDFLKLENGQIGIWFEYCRKMWRILINMWRPTSHHSDVFATVRPSGRRIRDLI